MSDPLALRRDVLARRDIMPRSDIMALSSRVVARLCAQPLFQQSRFPLFFISFRSEVYTHDMIKARLSSGKTVLVPRSLVRERKLEIFRIRNWQRDLVPGAYGILEPRPDRAEKFSDPALIDSVLVPGSVFDRKCGRYGYGGGFYDRFLSQEAVNAMRIGLAFQFQIMKDIPLAPHDQRLDMVITEMELITCNI